MDTVLQSFSYCLDYLGDQVADLTDVEMVAQPEGFLNHPAWVVGHLTCSCLALGGEIGLAPWLPKTWAKRFGTGSKPLSDVSAYESKSESLEILRDAQSRVTLAIQGLTPDQLDQPLACDHYDDVLPTVRHAVVQMLVAHTANHVGQLTMWRRAMGLPGIKRHFL